MAVVALLSAKGSPGVTSLTVALCLLWHEATSGRSALMVDADPAGGDVAAGVLAGAVPDSAGMLALATSRGQDAAGSVAAAAVSLRADGTARVVPGVPDSARAPALALAWDLVDRARPQLDDSTVDLLIDCGRVDAPVLNPPWLQQAELAVLVVRPTLPGVVSGRRFAEAWRERGASLPKTPSAPASAGPVARPPLHLVVVDAPGGYRPTEVREVLDLPLLAVIPHDPAGARVFSDGDPVRRGAHRSPLHRAVRGLGARMADEVGTAVAGIGPERPRRQGSALSSGGVTS